MEDSVSIAEMAHILGVDGRTIKRDKKEIYKDLALHHDPNLADTMMGRLVHSAEISIQRIRRTLRDKKTPSAVKVDGEFRCFCIFNEMIHTLQKAGYLPLATLQVDAQLTHLMDELPPLEDLQKQITELGNIEKQYGIGNEEIQGQIQKLLDTSMMLPPAPHTNTPTTHTPHAITPRDPPHESLRDPVDESSNESSRASPTMSETNSHDSPDQSSNNSTSSPTSIKYSGEGAVR